MKISSFTIYHIQLPFKLTVGHHLAERNFSENLIIEITTSEGITGYGEGVPRDYVTAENIESAYNTVASSAAAFLGKSFTSFSDLKDWLEGIGSEHFWQNNPSAFCAIELALLDAAGKYWKRPLYELINPSGNVKKSIRYSAVIPFSTPEAFEKLLHKIKTEAFSAVKLKVGRTIDWSALEKARAFLGDEVDIRVDANCAWQRAEAVANIEKMAKLGILSIEQPLAAHDREGIKEIKQAVRCKIIIDEGLSKINNALTLVSSPTCDIFNIRLSKCGGMINSMKIYEIGRSAGIRSQLGAQVGESGILSAAGRHFAVLHPDLVYHEGSFGSMLLQRDLTTEDVVFGTGGEAPPLTKPGLGVEINPLHLNELTVKKVTLG